MCPKPNPVKLFEELAPVVAVTFNEYVMYDKLLEHWTVLRERLPRGVRQCLRVELTDSGQLLVSWSGNSQTRRRLVLIAHVDQEGFLIEAFSPTDKECYGFAVNDETPFEGEERNEPVTIIARHGIYQGKIKSLDRRSRPRFTFEIESRSAPGTSKFRGGAGFGAVAVYRLPEWNIDSDGFIAAPCVDNRAGVSVVTSVLEGVAAAEWPVNIDVLYTTCEEAGFCGIVRHLAAHPDLVNDDDVTWIVVDSSNKNRAIVETLPDDLRRPFNFEQKRERIGIDLNRAVIRTGDKHHCFSRQVAQMLHAASLNALRKTGIFMASSEDCSLPGEFVFCDRDLLEKFGRQERDAVIGARMVGGWCDASAVYLSPYLGEAGQPWLRGCPRIGSLAIPISNHRNTSEGKVLAEKCHASALVTGMLILAEAAKLDWRFPYLDRGQRRAFDQNSTRRQYEAADVKTLKGWLAKSQDYFAATDSWIAETRRSERFFPGSSP